MYYCIYQFQISANSDNIRVTTGLSCVSGGTMSICSHAWMTKCVGQDYYYNTLPFFINVTKTIQEFRTNIYAGGGQAKINYVGIYYSLVSLPINNLLSNNPNVLGNIITIERSERIGGVIDRKFISSLSPGIYYGIWYCSIGGCGNRTEIGISVNTDDDKITVMGGQCVTSWLSSPDGADYFYATLPFIITVNSSIQVFTTTLNTSTPGAIFYSTNIYFMRMGLVSPNSIILSNGKMLGTIRKITLKDHKVSGVQVKGVIGYSTPLIDITDLAIGKYSCIWVCQINPNWSDPKSNVRITAEIKCTGGGTMISQCVISWLGLQIGSDYYYATLPFFLNATATSQVFQTGIFSGGGEGTIANQYIICTYMGV